MSDMPPTKMIYSFKMTSISENYSEKPDISSTKSKRKTKNERSSSKKLPKERPQ